MGKSSNIDPSKATIKVFNVNITASFPDGTNVDISSYLKKVRFDNNISKNMMPSVRFISLLPPDLIIKIQKYSNLVTFVLKSDYTDISTAGSGVTDSLFKSINLKPLLMDKDIIDINDLGETASASSSRLRFECVCVPEDALKDNKIVVSGNYLDATVTEVLLSLLTKTGKQIYLDPPDNDTRYPQIPLIPSNIISNIYNIDNIYGIYKDKLNIFSTYNKIIISPSKFNKFINQSTISVLVRFSSKSDKLAYDSSSYKIIDGATGYFSKNIIVDSACVGFSDRTELNNELFGNKLTYVSKAIDKDKIEDLTLPPIYDRNGTVDKKLLIEDLFDNSYSREFFQDSFQNNSRITMRLTNIDIEELDLFRQFNIKFDNSLHEEKSGIYRVDSISQTFNIGKGMATELINYINLRRIK